MHIHSYLNFDGDCAEAFRFYKKTLHGKDLSIMTFAQAHATEGMPKNTHKMAMHARLVVGGTIIMGSDAPGGRYNQPQGMHVSLTVAKPADADRIFKAFAKGGKVSMPIQETFWARRFGMVTDRFGTPWMVNCEKPMG